MFADQHFGPPFGRGPGFGGGRGFGGRGGGPGFGGGRGRRRRGDVPAALLLLLSEEPRNGYQLMQAIEELSGGRWRPSPGSIYPTLAQLEDQGLIRPIERDNTNLFELTDAGRAHLKEHPEHVPPWIDGEDSKDFRELRSQINQLHVAAMQVAHAGRDGQVAEAAAVLAEARRKLYRILAEEEDG